MNDLEMRVQRIEQILGRGNLLSSSVQQKDASFNGRVKLMNRTALPTHCQTGELCVRNGTQYVCSATDTWTATGGGSGSPGGADTYVQFNDAGNFGGDANLFWSKTTPALSVYGNNVTSPGGVATNATVGFLIPSHMNGAPTGAPSDCSFAIDKTNKKLWAYISGTWYSVQLI